MRLSLSFLGDRPMKEMIRIAQHAEDLGFDTIWLADHYCLREIVSCVTAISLTTSRIKVGTGVLNPYTRHPATVAMFVRTLQEMVGPRIILGIGAGLRPQEQLLGKTSKNSATAVKEWLEVTKRLFEDETVSYKGETLNVVNLKLGFAEGLPRPPVYVGAMARAMVEFAAGNSEGVLMTAGSSITYAQKVKQWIESVRRENPKAFDIALLAMLSVSGDTQRNGDPISRWLATFASLPSFGKMLEISGIDDADSRSFHELVKKIGTERAMSRVPQSLVDQLSISGSTERCRERIKEYERAGVSQLVVIPVGKDPIAELSAIA